MPSLHRLIDDEAQDHRCSFCGARPSGGAAIVRGRDACICDHCIASCAELVADEAVSDAGDQPGWDDAEAAPPEVDGHRPVFVRLLREPEVAGLISIDELVPAMAGALRRFSAGEVVQPVRTAIPVGDQGAFLLLMPAHVPEPGLLGAKLVSMFPGNAALGLPTHLATILLFSPETGALVAVMDGRHVTEARTAAVSALSARLLARPDAKTLAILGSGAQARSHLLALAHVLPLREARVWSPNPEHVVDFVDEMSPLTRVTLEAAGSAEDAVRDADVIVLATSATEPAVRNEWVKDGTHVVGLGACRPDQRELDPALVARGRLYVDSREAALVEAGDVVLGLREGRFTAAHIAGELGELVAGDVPGRRTAHEVTIFKSLGLAVEDMVAADIVYGRAVAQDTGREVEM